MVPSALTLDLPLASKAIRRRAREIRGDEAGKSRLPEMAEFWEEEDREAVTSQTQRKKMRMPSW